MEETLFDVMVKYFERDGWPYEQVEGQTILRLGYRADEIAWTCYAQALLDDQQFAFYSIAPVKVSPARLARVAEYITRANFSLILGNFEMDWETGEVRYKTSIDVEDDRLSYALWRPVVYANVFITERYLPGLIAVVYEDAAPEVAIMQAEAAP